MKKNDVLVLTDSGHILKLFERGFQVQSPCKDIWREFGLDDGPSDAGFLTRSLRGDQNINPQVGDDIYLWIDAKKHAIGARQKIRRIYESPLKATLKEIRSVWHMFDYEAIFWHLLVNFGEGHRINAFLSMVVGLALGDGQTWTFDKNKSDFLITTYQHPAFSSEFKLQPIFDCGLLTQDKDGRITVSEGLVVLTMEAIHASRPMATVFDEHGTLKYHKP